MSEPNRIIEVPATHFTRREERDLPTVQADPMTMLASAVQRGMDPDTIKGLMDLQERWETGLAVKACNKALAAFKAEAIEIIKNKRVHFTNKSGGVTDYKHAELSDVIEAIGPALSRHGFSWSWKTRQEKGWVEVTCMLKHELGHFDTVTLGAPPDESGGKNPVQQIVSTVSYLERHTLKAIAGVAEKGEDKDGRTAQASSEPEPEGKKALEACGSLSGLQDAWKGLTAAQRKTLNAVKEECKARIEKAEREASK